MDTNILEIFNELKELSQSVKAVNTSQLESAKIRLEQLFSSFERVVQFLDYLITTNDQIDDLQIVLGLACIHRIVRTNLASITRNDDASFESFKSFLLQLIQIHCGRSSQRIKLEIRQFVSTLFTSQIESSDSS